MTYPLLFCASYQPGAHYREGIDVKGHKAEHSWAICALTVLCGLCATRDAESILKYDRGPHTLRDLDPIIVMQSIGAGTLETTASGAAVKEDSAALSAPSQKVHLLLYCPGAHDRSLFEL